MAEYSIQDTTLTQIADSIRYYYNATGYDINHDYIDIFQHPIIPLISDTVTIYYREFIDFGGEYGDGAHDAEGIRVIMAYGHGYHSLTGEFTPTLYWTKDEGMGPDINEPLYYCGDEEIDGELYNKWQKFDWDMFNPSELSPKMFIYTNLLVTPREPIDTILPTEMPYYIDRCCQDHILNN